MSIGPDQSIVRLSAGGVEFSVWYEDESESLWINSRRAGDVQWASGVNVQLGDAYIQGKGGNADVFTRTIVMPALQAYIDSKLGGGSVPAPTFPADVAPLTAAVLALVRRFVISTAGKLALL